MERKMHILTSESVGKGHPDKICDQISDAILDQCLKQDPYAKVACEVFAANRFIVVGGEITTTGYVDITKTAWDILIPLGYNESDFTIISNVNSQSKEIADAVDKKMNNIGAGDQGVVYGYATNETLNFMPLTFNLATDIVKLAAQLIDKLNYKNLFKHDMKSQVSIDFSDSLNPVINTIVFSIQHTENANKLQIEKFCNYVIDKTVQNYKLNLDFNRLINNSGKFTIGGPIGDTGLTGRKLMVDTYGTIAKHGGGAFSGKDCTKVDRTGAYFARYIAKNIVAANFADKCEVILCYVIGNELPIALTINTFNTNKIDLQTIYLAVENTFNFELRNIIDLFELRKPIYSKYSVYGHFGRTEYNSPWEKLDKINLLKEFVKK